MNLMAITVALLYSTTLGTNQRVGLRIMAGFQTLRGYCTHLTHHYIRPVLLAN